MVTSVYGYTLIHQSHHSPVHHSFTQLVHRSVRLVMGCVTKVILPLSVEVCVCVCVSNSSLCPLLQEAPASRRAPGRGPLPGAQPPVGWATPTQPLPAATATALSPQAEPVSSETQVRTKQAHTPRPPGGPSSALPIRFSPLGFQGVRRFFQYEPQIKLPNM